MAFTALPATGEGACTRADRTRLAQVRFQGATATSDLSALTPELVHPHFSPDGARSSTT